MSFGRPDPADSSSARARANAPAGISWGWWAALALLVVAILVIGFLAINDESEPPLENTSVADVVADPAEYEGGRVAVTGRIDELLTDRAVAVGSDLAEGDLLVVIPANAMIRGYSTARTDIVPVPVGEFYDTGDIAQFAGEIREFDRDALAEEFDLVLNEEIFADREGDPVMVMDRLDVTTLGMLTPGSAVVPQPTSIPDETLAPEPTLVPDPATPVP